MKLTPKDIAEKEFKRGVRGYSEAEVDKFLDEVVADFEELYNENKKLQQDAKEALDKLQRFQVKEETLQNTIFAAQKVAEELQMSAKKESDEIVTNAKSEAEKLVGEAKAEREGILNSLVELRCAEKDFRNNFLNLMENFSRVLKGIEKESGVEEEVTPGEKPVEEKVERISTPLEETVSIPPEEVPELQLGVEPEEKKIEPEAQVPQPEVSVEQPEEAAPAVEEAAEAKPVEEAPVVEERAPEVSDEEVEEKMIKPEEAAPQPEKEGEEEEEEGPFGKSTEFEW